MSGFDDMGLFFVDTFSTDEINGGNDPNKINFMAIQKKLKDFLRVFHTGNFNYIYRDALRNNYNSGRHWLEVDLKDVSSYDEELGEQVKKQPTEVLPLFEDAAKEIADEITRPRPEGEEAVKPIQVMLRSEANPMFIRQLTSDQVAKLYKVSGIVVSASTIRAKATALTIQCRSCRSTQANIKVKPGMEGYALPRKCNADTAGRMNCPLDPFFVLPDSCKCVDSQTLKLQETPENVPNGEIPRHITLYVDRYLCDKIVPGNRVTVTGVYSIKRVGPAAGKSSLKEKLNIGIRQPYLRVIGIQIDSDGSQTTNSQTTQSNSNGIGSSNFLTNRIEEEEEFRRMAKSQNIYELISRSIAPSIWGFKDIKKAIACLLFGGSRKRLPDGLTRRGDINLLLLGDPGTAKSQLLKFVERVAPIAVYTSGKGSSAAGLTASVIRDPSTRNFMIEGGAMVLADGGVVCIDEFDKMREEDRVAIHEAMEQQTISIAKAGITTTLNSRCSVLAAANSVFGRWDDLKGDANIDFMPTILSRFDMIFIVKDEHNEERDATLARHVMNVHMNANVSNVNNKAADGEISLENLRRYISYVRSKCGPRLGEQASEKLKSQYVLMRSGTVQHERDTGKRMSIPITVRQLEAVVRISESIAKMRLSPFANDTDINEALRLFNVSTMSAAMTGSLTGVEGFTSAEDQEQLQRVEKQIRRRFVVGSQVSENAIIQDLVKQRYPEKSVYKVLQTMIRRGEVQHRAQRKLLFRIR